MMRKAKFVQILLMILLDVALTASIMLTFAYFHHVRMLRGIDGKSEVIEDFGADASQSAPAGETDVYPTPQSTPTPLHEHEWVVSAVVPPTCTEGGYTDYACSCGETRRDDLTEPTGHGEFTRVNEKEATYEEEGYTGDLYCGRCGILLEEGAIVPAKEHRDLVLINQLEPTCLDDGYTGDWFCNDEECQKVVAEGSVAPKLGHDYKTAESVAPTCYKDGYTVYRCARCGDETRTDLPQLVHDYKRFRTVEPTCQSGGYTIYRCEHCGDEKQEMPTAKTSHAPDDNGRCVYCGKVEIDRSGDFGQALGEKFLQSKSGAVHLTSDRAIREYAQKYGVSLFSSSTGSTYLSLYRSKDIFMTVREVCTRMEYGGTNMKVRYFVYDVYVRNLRNFFTELPADYSAQMADLTAQAEKRTGSKVLAAINGDYYGNRNLCKIAVRNGKLMRRHDDPFKNDILVMFYDGSMRPYTAADYDWEEIAGKRPYQIWQFGPSLLDGNGKAASKFDPDIYDLGVTKSTHPRAGIGYYEPGHYALVVADGRNPDMGVSGMYLEQFGIVFERLGCTYAYNLDGGDSAQAYLDGRLIRYDVTRKKTGQNQRNLCDIICIGEYN